MWSLLLRTEQYARQTKMADKTAFPKGLLQYIGMSMLGL